MDQRVWPMALNGPLLGAYREGATTHNGEPVGPEGLLEVASPATFQNELRYGPSMATHGICKHRLSRCYGTF